MVGWHHRLNGHEFEQAPGDSDGAWYAQEPHLQPGVLRSMELQRIGHD